MICNGKARSYGPQLVDYLMHSSKNDDVEVIRLSREDTLAAEIAHMEADATGTRCAKPLYHAQVRSRDGEHLTREQMDRAVRIYAEEMGFAGLPHAAVVHRFKGHDHLHIVWGRVDPETGRARDYKNDYAKQEQAGRRMEQEFGLAQTRGRFFDENGQAYTDAEDRKRSHRRTTKAEQGQQERSGMDPNVRKDQITSLWHYTTTGREFRSMLKDAGYTLAKGDRRDFVVIDRKGEAHSLARQVRGVRAAEIRARMADVNVSELPTVAEVRKQMRVQAGAERKHRTTEDRVHRADRQRDPPAPRRQPRLEPDAPRERHIRAAREPQHIALTRLREMNPLPVGRVAKEDTSSQRVNARVAAMARHAEVRDAARENRVKESAAAREIAREGQRQQHATDSQKRRQQRDAEREAELLAAEVEEAAERLRRSNARQDGTGHDHDL